jgi:hypothetical protein
MEDECIFLGLLQSGKDLAKQKEKITGRGV